VERAGWGNRLDDTLAWLREIAGTPLPQLNAPLSRIVSPLPEMEFWFPSERLSTGALDKLCVRHLLGGAARPALPERQLHGMLKGFADLVFEHEGRFWVLDYKSNALGAGDAAYHKPALVAAMAEHRYDIQGAIYMLALHRLLQSRLGDQIRSRRAVGRSDLPVPARDRQHADARLLLDGAGSGIAGWPGPLAGPAGSQTEADHE
jgi:exodeoxyribonuclease V beta subunit